MSEATMAGHTEMIVMGGSIGALEALAALLPALPSEGAVPLAIVIHLPPDRPSHLVEILSARAPLPVREVEDKQPIVAGTIYVAPPDYHLLVERGRTFALSADDSVNFSRPAIDVLFESAAEAYGDGLAGVLLTGASADGARGLVTVKRRGGLVVVQAPDDAMARQAPEAALALVDPDHVLPVTDLAPLLARLAVGERSR